MKLTSTNVFRIATVLQLVIYIVIAALSDDPWTSLKVISIILVPLVFCAYGWGISSGLEQGWEAGFEGGLEAVQQAYDEAKQANADVSLN